MADATDRVRDGQETLYLPVVASRGQDLVPVGPDRRPRRVIVLCALAVVAGTVGMLALIRPSEDKPAPLDMAAPMVFPTPSEAPAGASATPTLAPTTPPVEVTTAAPGSAALGATHRPSPSKSPSRPPGKPTTPSLEPGAVIGLEVAGRWGGGRVHHDDDFAVRVDHLTSSSSARDRASSRYVVRRGLASGDCLSFEAADHPGYYLRHRVFDMFLDRRDGSANVDQEATFCARPTRNRGTYYFETFYPSTDYAMVVGFDGELRVDEVDNEPASFVVRSPL